MSDKYGEFTIDKEGNLSIDKLEGFGEGCADFTAPLEKRMGIPDESSRKFTEEYNEPVEVKPDGIRI